MSLCGSAEPYSDLHDDFIKPQFDLHDDLMTDDLTDDKPPFQLVGDQHSMDVMCDVCMFDCRHETDAHPNGKNNNENCIKIYCQCLVDTGLLPRTDEIPPDLQFRPPFQLVGDQHGMDVMCDVCMFDYRHETDDYTNGKGKYEIHTKTYSRCLVDNDVLLKTDDMPPDLKNASLDLHEPDLHQFTCMMLYMMILLIEKPMTTSMWKAGVQCSMDVSSDMCTFVCRHDHTNNLPGMFYQTKERSSINKTLLQGMTSIFMTLSPNLYMRMINGNKKFLSVMYQNIPGTLSLENKVATIQSILDRENPDVIGFAEPSTQDLDTNWINYTLVPGYINTGNITRLNVLIKNDIVFKQMHWKVDVPHIILEILGWKIIFMYCEWARAGDQMTKSFDQQLTRWQSFVQKWQTVKGLKSILLGDCNFDFLSSSGHQRQLNPLRELTKQQILSTGWYQLINENTRYQKNNIPSCLDHLYARSVGEITTVLNRNITGYDHNMIGASINISKHFVHPTIIYYRDINNVNVEDFAHMFHSTNLYEIYDTVDVDEAVERLTHKIKTVLDIVAPLKRKSIPRTTSVPWMTSDIKARIQFRNMLRNRAVKSNSDDDWKTFKSYRNLLKTEMLRRKREYITAQITKQNSNEKARWRHLKFVGGVSPKKQQDIELVVDGQRLTKSCDVAEHLNKYYVKKVTPPNQSSALDYTQEYIKSFNIKEEFEFQPVNAHDVLMTISQMKMTESAGHDDVNTRVIKRFKEVLAHPIARIVNLAIMTSRYPKSWKLGIISPVPKGGDKTLDQNWRPVTLLCCLSKILEKTLNQQLKTFIEAKKILSPTQHAYRSKKSCQTAWIDIDSKVNKALDSGHYVGMLMVDISSAFNLISKEIIVPKLRMIGVGHFAAKLIGSYLTGRKSRTRISGVLSTWIAVFTGIGEGSVLGPLIFILTIVCVSVVLLRVKLRLEAEYQLTAKMDDGIYDNDISLSSTEFADDCTGLAVCKTEQQVRISLDIMAQEFKKYFEAHGLKINVKKSEHLVIGGPRTISDIKIEGRSEAKTVKLLGITFSNKYTFDNHTTNITNKISSRLGMLTKVVPYADLQTAKMLADSMLVSVATYGCEVYAVEKGLVNKVQVKLNQVMRIITLSGIRRQIREMLDDLKWLKFEEMVKYTKIMIMSKLTFNNSAPFCKMLVVRGMSQRQDHYNVRQRELRIAWRPRTSRRGQQSFLVSALKLYNDSKVAGKGIETDKDKMKEAVKSAIISWRK